MAEYKTCDLYLAATIQAAGIKMIRHAQEDGRVYFYYQDEQEIVSKITQEFYSHLLEIDALALVENIKSLKTLCSEIKRDKRGGRHNYA